MNAIKKALFEKAWEKEQNYNDAVARWGEDNLASNGGTRLSRQSVKGWFQRCEGQHLPR